MTRAIAILRPEPGNSATARRVEAAGYSAIRLPLFVVRPLPWPAPGREHDALILTSANAMRHGGAQLAALTHLPVYAVGAATATSAQAMGFRVAHVGTEGADALLEQARSNGIRRALHLTGRDHRLGVAPPIVELREVYASEACEIDEGRADALIDSVAMVHSPRAGAALAALCESHGLDRSRIAVAAISDAAAQAAGDGWQAKTVPAQIGDAALVDAAIALAD